MFHYKDGWFFNREVNGSIRIERRYPPKENGTLLVGIVIDPDSWASIVAHLSDGGETPERRDWIKDFHGADNEK